MINLFCHKIVICISLKVWESQSGKELLSLTGHSDAVYCCAFSSNDARIVSCSADHTVKVLTQQRGDLQLLQFTVTFTGLEKKT